MRNEKQQVPKRVSKQVLKPRIPVAMYLPQSKGKPTKLLYELFEKRVARKSGERNDDVVDPTQLILAFTGVTIDTQMGVVVSKDSFERLVQPIGRAKGSKLVCEFGFKARIESVFGIYWLFVYKKGKAYLEKA